MTPAVVSNRVIDLRLSEEAATLARQLAEPDGNVLFVTHPLSNSQRLWSVTGDGHLSGGMDGWRQLLAYGLGQIAPMAPPLVERNAWGDEDRYEWKIVLTERGRAWVADNCPRSIQPPSSGQQRRRIPTPHAQARVHLHEEAPC